MCAVTKSCGQVRALVTLSPRPCCRGGVRACVVCTCLGIVTWAGREVTITIRLLYGPYTIDASPHHGFIIPHRFWAQRKTPTIPQDNGGNLDNLRTDQPTTTPAPRPRTATTGQPGPRQHTLTSRDRSLPRGVPSLNANQRINSQILLSLELASNRGRARTIKPIRGDRPTTILHALLPTLQIRTVRVITRHGRLLARLRTEIPALR